MPFSFDGNKSWDNVCDTNNNIKMPDHNMFFNQNNYNQSGNNNGNDCTRFNFGGNNDNQWNNDNNEPNNIGNWANNNNQPDNNNNIGNWSNYNNNQPPRSCSVDSSFFTQCPKKKKKKKRKSRGRL